MSTVLKDPIEILTARLAKLGPKTIRFDIGAGGGPGLTSQDIAAALGMTPAGLGRDMLEFVWVPDSFKSKSRREALMSRLTEAQLLEHNERERVVARALFQVAIRGESARHLYNEALAQRWPSLVAKAEPLEFARGYEVVRLGVLEELRYPRQCPKCHGLETEGSKDAVKTCPRCLGQGVVEFGNTRRAQRFDIQRSAYIKTWQEAYEWLLARAREEMYEAVSEMCRRLK
ncbi:hypothetical protein P3W33_18010 [Luteibacter sp. PPL552]